MGFSASLEVMAWFDWGRACWVRLKFLLLDGLVYSDWLDFKPFFLCLIIIGVTGVLMLLTLNQLHMS
jgi:hypothetical protein